jgi:hypothetical protein
MKRKVKKWSSGIFTITFTTWRSADWRTSWIFYQIHTVTNATRQVLPL